MTSPDGPAVIERALPLSQSLFWSINRDYWISRGVAAWNSGDVPFMLTSGPLLARRYARVIEGFVADCLAGRLGPVDSAEPLYVVELGAGPGRLGAMVLHALEDADVGPMRLVYVLSDLAESNLELWRHKDELRRFVESGRLDFALYDAGSEAPLHLELSGVDLRPGELANPLVALANYLFCTIPQDLFAVLDGDLYEEHVAILAPTADIGPSSPDFLKQVFVATSLVEVPEPRYGERLDRVLHRIAAARDDGRQRFLFPETALRAMQGLLGLSSGRMMMLVGDRFRRDRLSSEGLDAETLAGSSRKGYSPGQLLGMGVHGGSMSMSLDLDALVAGAEESGTEMLVQRSAASAVGFAAVVAGDEGGASEVRSRFRDAFRDPASSDLYLAIRMAMSGQASAPIESLLAVVRASGYDPYALVGVFDALGSLLPDANDAVKDEFVRIARRTYEVRYTLEEVSDLAFGIASLLYAAERPREALEFYAASRIERGPRPQVGYNAALCHILLGDVEAAISSLDDAMAVDPSFDLAATLKEKLLAGEVIL